MAGGALTVWAAKVLLTDLSICPLHLSLTLTVRGTAWPPFFTPPIELSLAGVATSIIFVTKNLGKHIFVFVTTDICHDKNILPPQCYVTATILLSRQKVCFVVTKLAL